MPAVWQSSSCRPVWMGCRTGWRFSLVGGWHLWKSKLQKETPPAPGSKAPDAEAVGFMVYVLDDEGQIGGIMDEIQSS